MNSNYGRFEARRECGPHEGEPEPCPFCGEPLTGVLGGPPECEATGCIPCSVCGEHEAIGDGRLCELCAPACAECHGTALVYDHQREEYRDCSVCGEVAGDE